MKSETLAEFEKICAQERQDADWDFKVPLETSDDDFLANIDTCQHEIDALMHVLLFKGHNTQVALGDAAIEAPSRLKKIALQAARLAAVAMLLRERILENKR